MALWVPDFLQTKRYSAQRLRAMIEDTKLQEGVVNFSTAATSMQVKQKQSGANMSVDIFGGSGWVKGDTSARQGLYHVVNDASFNLAVGSNSSGNPRLDQVICRINDTTHGGVGDTATFEILAGTATGGATLDNRTGAAALPASAMRLADILVASGAASITDSVIRDRRQWAHGGRYFYQYPLSGTNLTTSSTTYVSIDSTNLSRRMEVGPQGQVKVELHGYVVGAIESGLFDLFINGTARNDTRIYTIPSTNYNMLMDITWYVNDLTAGSYLFEPRWKSGSSGAIQIARNGTTSRPQYLIEEDLRPYGSNGAT